MSMDREAGKKTVEQAKTHSCSAKCRKKNVSVERGCLPPSLTHSRKHLTALTVAAMLLRQTTMLL